MGSHHANPALSTSIALFLPIPLQTRPPSPPFYGNHPSLTSPCTVSGCVPGQPVFHAPVFLANFSFVLAASSQLHCNSLIAELMAYLLFIWVFFFFFLLNFYRMGGRTWFYWVLPLRDAALEKQFQPWVNHMVGECKGGKLF